MKKLNEKQIPYEDAQVHWCPSMDLIGVTSRSQRLIEVYQCTDKKLQRLFQRPDASGPTSFSFEQVDVKAGGAISGKLCAVGFEDGRLCIIKTDNEIELFQH